MKLNELVSGILVSYYPSHKVCFSAKVINILKKFVQDSEDSKEAGGLLIGYKRGNHFEITDITYPYDEDNRERSLFERNDKRHLHKFKKLVFCSFGRKSFLGEWHTHPEINPTPSSMDIIEWKKTVQSNFDTLLFLIIGIDSIYLKTSDTIF